ncbi:MULTISPECIES: hypothetical protein [unclassified Streptomyces]|uniref:hypothetical protein n=1 Tax=unclassified Streptomyces TaxID=2593676 RepID=UPI002DD878BD|nr:hypothetical protein [Streptomyces sp. NBC_00243]WRZ17942.1 hypothetical protein OHT59_05280 [Streptomyces sp. NBC_00243]
MNNPFGDEGILTRAIPWISIILVIALAGGAMTSDLAVIVKVLIMAAAIAVIARSVLQIVRQMKKI